ncbi:hypothetical protein C8F04DRAFT_457262 [Mycena alexandri]|uniref:STAS domain-containing protein n=1 Tax=Mycena alexandri TaxID=1745969 RepID=A0AAD6T0K2_9AGAR|nr:hypothetical protein C8F04DRAFT_457262 [Mycena alexandri]
MFIMSALTSQIPMTLGGSRFPGGVGAMLIEILPFLRGVAIDIRGALGDDHPGLVPTVMAAYALSSILTGVAFLLLGLLKIGSLVAYFPQTVLTGAVGAIGLSLFVLGLGLPLSPSATPLALSNVASTLFYKGHLGILAASFFPALILAVTLRSRYVELWTRGFSRSPYYVPVCMFTVLCVFWIVVRSLKIRHEHLITAGWLFAVHPATSSSALVASWNYWALFNFKLVEWWAFKSAIQNLVLSVVIGVLNLPIYVPTIAFTLDMSYDMDHELLGQGVGNIFAGLVGTIPNIIQYSYSVYVTRAKGGRFELAITIALSIALFFTAGLLLPYVPTILASVFVLFIGIELFLEAMWEASKTLTWMEYGVVVSTLVACTFLGFAQGFGVGIGAATFVYFMYGVIDSPARVTRWNEWNELQQTKNQDEDHVSAPLEGRLLLPRNHTPAAITLNVPQTSAVLSTDVKTVADPDLLQKLNARVLVLSGYIFFASVPSLERALLSSSDSVAFFILDLERAHRIETAAARGLLRCVRDLQLKNSVLVVCGVRQLSGLQADFARAEVPLVFDPASAGTEKGVPAFVTREACLVWCQKESDRRMALADKVEGVDTETMNGAFETFCQLFDFELDAVLNAEGLGMLPAVGPTTTQMTGFIEAGGHITTYLPGQNIQCVGIAFVVEGELHRISAAPTADTGVIRPSVQRLFTVLPRETLRALRNRFPALARGEAPRVRVFKPGNVLDSRSNMDRVVAKTGSSVVDIRGGKLIAWAQATLDGQTQTD